MLDLAREDVKNNFRGKGVWHNPCDISNLYCARYRRNGSHEANDCRVPWEKIKEDIWNQKEDKGKTLELMKVKAPHYIVAHT
jgi:hypothetical protein